MRSLNQENSIGAPRKVQINQLVKIQSKERTASTLERELHIYGGDKIDEAEGINEL